MQKNPSEPAVFRRHPRITLLCLVALFCLVIDIGAGSAYRWIYGYSLHDRAAVMRHKIETSYRIRSEIFHHTLASNKIIDDASWGSATYSFRSNSIGFRDANVREIELDTNRWRILLIGDSFTEGIGVRYEDTFSGRIADAYNDINIEVLNAGVISYSPIIYWRKIKYLIEEMKLDFDEVVVFLDISDARDEAEHYTLNEHSQVISRKSGKSMPSVVTGFGNFLRTYTVATYMAADILERTLRIEPDHMLDQREALWTIDESYYLDYGKNGLELMAFYMDKLFDLLQSHDIGLTIAVYPWPDQIVEVDRNSIQVKFWDEWSNRHDIAFMNYFPYFIVDANMNNQEAKAKEILTKYFIPNDYHWNAQGHKLIADQFLGFHGQSEPGTQQRGVAEH